MTHQKALFIVEYLKDRNATQAAIRCGYSPNSAGRTGWELLHDPEVEKAITDGLNGMLEKTKVTCESLLLHLDAMKNADPADILTEDGQHILPLREWPLIWRQSLNGFEFIEELGKGGLPVGYLRKIKWISREKVLEMIGKHVDINAFNRKELTGVGGGPIEVNSTPTLSQDEAQALLAAQGQNNSKARGSKDAQ